MPKCRKALRVLSSVSFAAIATVLFLKSTIGRTPQLISVPEQVEVIQTYWRVILSETVHGSTKEWFPRCVNSVPAARVVSRGGARKTWGTFLADSDVITHAHVQACAKKGSSV